MLTCNEPPVTTLNKLLFIRSCHKLSFTYKECDSLQILGINLHAILRVSGILDSSLITSGYPFWRHCTPQWRIIQHWFPQRLYLSNQSHITSRCPIGRGCTPQRSNQVLLLPETFPHPLYLPSSCLYWQLRLPQHAQDLHLMLIFVSLHTCFTFYTHFSPDKV